MLRSSVQLHWRAGPHARSKCTPLCTTSLCIASICSWGLPSPVHNARWAIHPASRATPTPGHVRGVRSPLDIRTVVGALWRSRGSPGDQYSDQCCRAAGRKLTPADYLGICSAAAPTFPSFNRTSWAFILRHPNLLGYTVVLGEQLLTTWAVHMRVRSDFQRPRVTLSSRRAQSIHRPATQVVGSSPGARSIGRATAAG